MSFERSKFGDGSAAGAGNVTQTVSNHYGPRDTGKTAGVQNTFGGVNELVIDLDAEVLAASEIPLVAPTLFAGSLVKEVYLEVSEAFDVSAVIEVGTAGSEATNGVTISIAQAEAVGVYDITSAVAGTWAAGLTANLVVGIDYAGTVTDAGEARLVIRYVRV